MIEHDAALLWCPFAQTYADNSTGNAMATVNRLTSGRPPTDCRCLASKCMAWRWYTALEVANGEEGGYCGLAGYAQRRPTMFPRLVAENPDPFRPF